jgi:hypothetical protein
MLTRRNRRKRILRARRSTRKSALARILHFAVTFQRWLFLLVSAERTDLIAVGTAHGQSNQPIPTLKGSNTKEPRMAQTLVSLLVHVIFSTRNRQSLITPEVEPQLFAYIGGILKNNASRLIDAGGTADHVHLIISQSKNISLGWNTMSDICGSDYSTLYRVDVSSSARSVGVAHGYLVCPLRGRDTRPDYFCQVFIRRCISSLEIVRPSSESFRPR